MCSKSPDKRIAKSRTLRFELPYRVHVHMRYCVRTLSALQPLAQVREVKYQVKYFTGLRVTLFSGAVWREKERERRHTFVDVGNRLM